MSNHVLKALFCTIIIFIAVPAICETITGTGTGRGRGRGCSYTSIFSFGDSLADTGNALHLSNSSNTVVGFPPYGNTFFHHPTGRFSDGRLVIDFIAEYLGLPYVPPYFGGQLQNKSYKRGVNFAVAGATALDHAFFEERKIASFFTNVSLGVQIQLFKSLLPSLCSSLSDCAHFLGNSLILMGEIGGNDMNYAFFVGKDIEEIRGFVPFVISAIASAITEMIELGAKTLLVPGNLPLGCSPIYLTMYQSLHKDEYDPFTGCLNWLNDFAIYYNQQLQIELDRVRTLHPQAHILYADYYHAAHRFYTQPDQFGFIGRPVIGCCGGGGPYNVNVSSMCGSPEASLCDDPCSYVNWDGIHLTESAYKLIAEAVLEGPYTIPSFDTSCQSTTFNILVPDH